MKMRALILLTLLPTIVAADALILPMQERAAVIDAWLDTRVQTVLPDLMRRSEIDMWIIISREYNEDPVIRTFLPATWQSARRRTILMIFDPGDGKALETLAVARYGVGKTFERPGIKKSTVNSGSDSPILLQNVIRSASA
jgi:hypothetical protein